jgi:hypothetical protein
MGADRIVRSNAEMNERIRRVALRDAGTYTQTRVLNAAELSPEDRARYGFDANWRPGQRRRGGRRR